MDKLNNLLSRGSEEQYNDVTTNMLHLKRITLKGPTQMFFLTVTHHDVLNYFLAILF